jgi:hypothetical protein
MPFSLNEKLATKILRYEVIYSRSSSVILVLRSFFSTSLTVFIPQEYQGSGIALSEGPNGEVHPIASGSGLAIQTKALDSGSFYVYHM